MKELTINNTTIVFEQTENGVFTDSRTIANVFGKEHDNVLKTIRNTVEEEDFHSSKITAKIKLRKVKEKVPTNGVAFDIVEKEESIVELYLLDRDLFVELVMGFTGKEAKKWKRDYIKAFNAMEKKLLNPKPVKELSPMELVALAYEKEAESHKKTQNLLH